MKNNSKSAKRRFIRVSSSILTMVALLFASAPCIGRIYEPKLPEELRR